MKPLLLFLLLSTAAWGQDKTDTVPVTILVRIQGRPWAFFHDGWEVRKHSKLPRKEWIERPVGIVYVKDGVYYDEIHVGYLDSKKRPIRKEWVVYQTFKR